jgi:SAM-dependent methyltransferase
MREFEGFANQYDALLKDPIRDRFTAGNSLFFHCRKRDLIRKHFERYSVDTRKLAYLDLGCGKGELAKLLREDFARVSGCDPSAGMMRSGQLEASGVETRVQEDPGTIPFPDNTFDFVTAVCVYHHVSVAARAPLTSEAFRVLKPGGWFAMIEHNPFNPVTRLIVSRTPVDADAILLKPSEARALLEEQHMKVTDERFFLYFPESLYKGMRQVEALLGHIPLGGQYAMFGRLPE